MASMGIDFGTCFSSAGFINGNKMMALKPQTEKKPGRIPSVFYHDKKATCYGTEALKRGKNKPEFMVEYVKKKLDESFFALDGQQYTPFEIVRELMEYVIQGAEQSAREEFQLGDRENWNAVVTVPVTFSESRKRMLRQAAENVEISNNRHVNIIEIIPEPVAAAISYLGMDQKAGRSILVYDLGGGTFDTAIVQSTGNQETPYKVIGQDGRGIGGNDWDESLLEILMEKIFDKMEDIPEERRYSLLGKERARLLQLARQIKEDLSETEQVEEEIGIRDEDYMIEISRKEFEDATRHLLDETIRPVARLVKKFQHLKISEIILVGGSSYMPQVFNTLAQRFPEIAVHRVNPELAISFGAA